MHKVLPGGWRFAVLRTVAACSRHTHSSWHDSNRSEIGASDIPGTVPSLVGVHTIFKPILLQVLLAERTGRGIGARSEAIPRYGFRRYA